MTFRSSATNREIFACPSPINVVWQPHLNTKEQHSGKEYRCHPSDEGDQLLILREHPRERLPGNSHLQ